jgi:hypothetical protein
MAAMSLATSGILVLFGRVLASPAMLAASIAALRRQRTTKTKEAGPPRPKTSEGREKTGLAQASSEQTMRACYLHARFGAAGQEEDVVVVVGCGIAGR